MRGKLSKKRRAVAWGLVVVSLVAIWSNLAVALLVLAGALCVFWLGRGTEEKKPSSMGVLSEKAPEGKIESEVTGLRGKADTCSQCGKPLKPEARFCSFCASRADLPPE